jgi:hypothetical protein
VPEFFEENIEVSKAVPISSRKTRFTETVHRERDEMAFTKPVIRHAAKSAVLGMVFVEAVRILDELVLLGARIRD